MKACWLPYVRHNIIAAGLLLATIISSITGGFLLQNIIAEDQALNPTLNGESGGFIVLIMWGLAIYTMPFGLMALGRALRHDSAPMPLWVLLLGLLPTIWLGMTFLWLFWTDFA